MIEVLRCNVDLFDLQSCDIVVCGANSSEPILTKAHLKIGAIVVDLAVPANAVPEVQESSEYVYLKGGIIELPLIEGVPQELNSVIFPFEKGESYACMAETIALAFEGQTQNDFTGPITLSKLQEIERIMAKHGFRVKRLKVKDSF
jgi:predicted amino acid dehydrogenase